jgi:hypothetical protein
VGPAGIEVGKIVVGEKNSFFGRNALQIAIFMAIPPFCHHATLQGRSGVRGKAGPNWVRKVSIVFTP